MITPTRPLGPDALDPAVRRALDAGAVALHRDTTSRFMLTGPGRVDCLQGLVTCDLARAEVGTAVAGALLTPKGMIRTLLWIAVGPDALVVETPTAGTAALAEVFQRSLPPRVCRATDRTADTHSLGVYGPGAQPFEGSWPAVLRGVPGHEAVLPAADSFARLAALRAAGAVAGDADALEVARIEAGLPALGAEIDDRTLPQEVGLDLLGAVSFTKGCYTGQETVARLHFRGHPNRRLVQFALTTPPPGLPAPLLDGDRPVGHLTSAAWSGLVDAWVGVGVIRRDVADDAELALPDGARAAVRPSPWLRPG